MSFDYPWTCPKIDSCISDAKNNIEDLVRDLISDVSPYVEGEYLDKLTKEWSDHFYSNLEGIFEGTRSENEDMRSAADTQISELKDRISDLEEELSSVEN